MGCMSFKEAQNESELKEKDGDLFANPKQARNMRGKMRKMMNGMMKVTPHNNDCTQKEVADFMNPYSVGKPFKDAPGTFDPGMKPRVKDTMMSRRAAGRPSAAAS